VLWDDGTGRYSNRWGKGGEKWQADPSTLAFDPVVYGGEGGTGCEYCVPSSTGTCYDPCVAWPGATQACCAEMPVNAELEGTPLFFPIDSGPGLLTETRSEGKVPDAYGWLGYPWETSVADALDVETPVETAHSAFPSTAHNFNFTSEAKIWLRHAAGETLLLQAEADDDLWIFVNGRLALDLGSWHVPLDGSLSISESGVSVSARLEPYDDPVVNTLPVRTFGLEDGQVFAITLFHAERQKETAALKLALSGKDLKRSVCVPEE
jgi:fibro-slime domain-containing protein